MLAIKCSAAAVLLLSIILAACSRHQTTVPDTLRLGAQPTQTYAVASKTVLVKQTLETTIQPNAMASATPFKDLNTGRPEPTDEPLTINVEGNHSADNSGRQSNSSLEETISGKGKLITSFTVRPATADPGDTVTVEWHTTNVVTVTVWHLLPTGQMGEFWPAAEEGSLNYTISAHERNRSTFALTAQDEQGLHEIATTAVTLRCTGFWFFEPAPDICPVEQPLISAAALQHFENGVMIWVAEEDLVYILYDDASSPRWTVFADSWTESQANDDPTLTPPQGLDQPIRGFGLIWRSQPGVRDRLGWALDSEAGYETAVQRTSYAKYNHTYIRAPDGGLWHLEPERSGWNIVAP